MTKDKWDLLIWEVMNAQDNVTHYVVTGQPEFQGARRDREWAVGRLKNAINDLEDRLKQATE